MSQELKSKISFIEIATILIFVLGVVFIFLSQNNTHGYERETLNARRFQDVSKIADALWQLNLRDPAFVEFRASLGVAVTCDEQSISTENLNTFLVPQFFTELPKDPNGQAYRVAFHEDKTLTVCSLWGEGENGEVLPISITR